MSHMFHNCWGLTSFPILNWNISNVQDLSFIFRNVPLHLIKFKWNISKNQNTSHMFTDFVGPPLGEDTINILFYFHTGIKQTMFANSNILFMDLIDIFYKRNANLYNIFNIVFLFNGKIIDN